MIDENVSVMEFIKNTKLKGKVEIINDSRFIWDIGGLFLHFIQDDGEVTIEYAKKKNMLLSMGHFHKDNCNAIHLIKDINDENNRVHVVSFLLGSRFFVEDKLKKRKKSFLFIRHYYSNL